MNPPPLVSVVMPTYNCGSFIGGAIQSVLAQTYPRCEIVVVDDGSTDNTREMLAPYLSQITYIHQANQGVVAARNAAIRRARGDLIAFLDSDDTWHPEKLQAQVRATQAHPDAGFVFTDLMEFDETGVLKPSHLLGRPRAQLWFENRRDAVSGYAFGWLFEELLKENWIHTSTLLARKNLVEKAGLFDEAFTICQDYDLWLRLARISPGVYVNQVLCGYRARREGISGVGEIRSLRWNHDTLRVLEKHLREHGIPAGLQKSVKARLSHLHWKVGRIHLRKNEFTAARGFFLRGIRYRPIHRRNWQYLIASLFLPMVTGLRSPGSHDYSTTQG